MKRPTYERMSPPEYVDYLLGIAAKRDASDIYILPEGNQVRIQFRIKGIADNIAEIPRDYGDQCISRIKVLAGLLTYKNSTAQDGAIRGLLNIGSVEMRVSIMPTSHGERIAIRLLHATGKPLLLNNLNLSDQTVKSIKQMLQKATGMIILTGPTGSGKTTTIYAMIRELLETENDPASIITIEDPIEAEIESISQTHVQSRSDWEYASAFRAALRQDVKTIVVGEMRDKDIVGVTLDAALTGHRIITTYHAGDIPSVYARMLHHGYEPFLIASAITGVISQRLISAKDGSDRIPIAATLVSDSSWRDFIATAPSLSELYKRIQALPEADIEACAEKAYESGAISKEQLLILTKQE